MKDLKGTETEKNLLIAFAGESQARNRYAIFAKKAKKEGYVQIYETFLKISEQERAHASRLFKFFNGSEVEITATFPTAPAGTTLDNLNSAAEGENYEYVTMYPEFAGIARNEGFEPVAVVLEALANAEKHHEEVFRKLAIGLEDRSIFKKEREVVWHCIKCGYTYIGIEAPKACPACAHSRAYFEVLGEMQ
jgi:rubrerythrin